MPNTGSKHPQPTDDAAARKAAEERAAEQIEHDQDRDPPRTAVPPESGKTNRPPGSKG